MNLEFKGILVQEIQYSHRLNTHSKLIKTTYKASSLPSSIPSTWHFRNGIISGKNSNAMIEYKILKLCFFHVTTAIQQAIRCNMFTYIHACMGKIYQNTIDDIMNLNHYILPWFQPHMWIQWDPMIKIHCVSFCVSIAVPMGVCMYVFLCVYLCVYMCVHVCICECVCMCMYLTC